jgi:ADP-heptose:LPS heptosyltransferase
VGSPDESIIADSIVAGTPLAECSAAHNVCGAFSVGGTAAFIGKARAVICNDSGLMHVAAAMGTPLIALFGPTEYDRTRPFVDNCVILRKSCACNHGTLFNRKTLAKIEKCDRPCLRSTTSDEVLQCMEELCARPRVSLGANGEVRH